MSGEAPRAQECVQTRKKHNHIRRGDALTAVILRSLFYVVTRTDSEARLEIYSKNSLLCVVNDSSGVQMCASTKSLTNCTFLPCFPCNNVSLEDEIFHRGRDSANSFVDEVFANEIENMRAREKYECT